MERRKFVLAPGVREQLIAQVDAHAAQLIGEHSMDAEDASELVEKLVGGGLALALRIAGTPAASADAVGHEIGAFIGNAVDKIEEALKRDPEKVMERANKALRNGHSKRAARLFKRASELFAEEEVAKAKAIEAKANEAKANEAGD
jgi:hypothetical protein